ADGTAPIAIATDGPGTAGGARTVAAACGLVAVSLEHDPAAQRRDPQPWLRGHTGILATTVEDAAECRAVLSRTPSYHINEPGRLRIAASDSPLVPKVPGLRGQLFTSDSDTVKSLLDVVR